MMSKTHSSALTPKIIDREAEKQTLSRAIAYLEMQIGAARNSSLPAPFGIYRAKRILEKSGQGSFD
jgi:hypothetical protein